MSDRWAVGKHLGSKIMSAKTPGNQFLHIFLSLSLSVPVPVKRPAAVLPVAISIIAGVQVHGEFSGQTGLHLGNREFATGRRRAHVAIGL